jgi:hypothetical protein
MKTSQSNRKKARYGPNIVRAWFDTIFHYALSGLANETAWLSQRNWTFRFYRQSLEYIGTLRQSLPFAAVENLEQFLEFFPAAARIIEQHDHRVEELRIACIAYYKAIVDNPRFQEVFRSVATEAPVVLNGDFSAHFGAFRTEEEFAGLLAEYLVNNMEDLPSSYATSRLWNQFRDRFVAVARSPELAAYKDEVDASGHRLLEAAEELTKSLKTTRSELSLEFDVPYVAEITSAR